MANSHLKWPTVELPVPFERILDVDAVIVAHTHLDHWDDAAKSLIPKRVVRYLCSMIKMPTS
ncbi:MBL fold metallo-hydrolase [Burkholderia cepacia]|uniref:MBL fold metallo-hydrolase n=1 Tax=Burkholderia cepacia TaxID=292 RepID=UPI001588940E|nr:hypothetical protein [Burkholderia cepacia]